MDRVTITVEEEELPIVQSIFHIARTVRPLYGEILDLAEEKQFDEP